MNKTNEYRLALMTEIKNKRLELYKLYVEVQDGNKIRYRAIDGSGKEQEGIILQDKAHIELNWHLLDNNVLSSFEGDDIKTVVFSEAIDSGHIPLSHNQKWRRAGLLCKNFSKNYAYYKAGWDKRITIEKSDFWITINNNFHP